MNSQVGPEVPVLQQDPALNPKYTVVKEGLSFILYFMSHILILKLTVCPIGPLVPGGPEGPYDIKTIIFL